MPNVGTEGGGGGVGTGAGGIGGLGTILSGEPGPGQKPSVLQQILFGSFAGLIDQTGGKARLNMDIIATENQFQAEAARLQQQGIEGVTIERVPGPGVGLAASIPSRIVDALGNILFNPEARGFRLRAIELARSATGPPPRGPVPTPPQPTTGPLPGQDVVTDFTTPILRLLCQLGVLPASICAPLFGSGGQGGVQTTINLFPGGPGGGGGAMPFQVAGGGLRTRMPEFERPQFDTSFLEAAAARPCPPRAPAPCHHHDHHHDHHEPSCSCDG